MLMHLLLSNISHEGVNLISLLDQPGKDTRCVYMDVRHFKMGTSLDLRRTKASGVGEENATFSHDGDGRAEASRCKSGSMSSVKIQSSDKARDEGIRVRVSRKGW
jgi:hypothetical protein